ncbi:hypothetical protein Gotur_018911, partial [Gossypium turneri]
WRDRTRYRRGAHFIANPHRLMGFKHLRRG